MIFAFGELTPLGWGLLWAAFYFAAQLLLCFKAKSAVLKNIPAVIAVGSFTLGICSHMGIFGKSSIGALPAHQIIGLLIMGISTIAAIGVLAGWVVFWIYKLIKKNKKV